MNFLIHLGPYNLPIILFLFPLTSSNSEYFQGYHKELSPRFINTWNRGFTSGPVEFFIVANSTVLTTNEVRGQFFTVMMTKCKMQTMR